MAEVEVVTGYPLKCKGAYGNLDESVDVSYTLYQNGARQVGCIWLEDDGKCGVIKFMNKLECPYLKPVYRIY